MSDLITCYDTIADDQFPAGAAAYAGYVDGQLDDQPNYSFILAQFPNAEHLSITLFADVDADTADVENGAMAPADVPGWHARQVARGIARPVVYASAWTMQHQVLPVLAGAGIGRAAVRLWTAHYGQGEHICGPGSCGALGTDADGSQWTPNALGRDLDQSALLPGFFGELPAGWTYGPPLALAATGGHTSVRLEWQPPQGYPELPAAYRIWVYRGTHASAGTLVPSYPRTAAGLDWEGGSLERGKVYTAHVSAEGPGSTRLRDFGFAAAIFMTG
jgi:hypothetical protein